MKHLIKKSRAAALFLAVAVVLSGLFVAPANTVKAAESDTESTYDLLLNENGTATAGNAQNHTFNVAYSTYLEIAILVPNPIGMNVQITPAASPNDTFTEDVASTSTYWEYESALQVYCYELGQRNPITGDYTLSFTFDTDTPYIVMVSLDKPAGTISDKSLVLTKGFSKTLSVSNATVTKWSSNKPKVAAVDSKGKVTAKAAGSATITATTTTGETLTCSVQVKANAYTHAKMNWSDARYGNAYISITNVSYNKKGDLVIKGSYLNNCGHKIVKLTNIKISVKNKSGKVIGTYTAKSQNASILHGGSKSFTYTVKKSKLKLKTTQDLRQAKVSPSWKYYRSAY